MAAFVVYDPATGILSAVWRCSNPASVAALMAANTPAGAAALAVSESAEAVMYPGRWKVVAGALQQKTEMTITVASGTITVAPAAVAQLMAGPVPVTTAADGTAAMPSGVASPAVVVVAGADPNYWSATVVA